MTKRERLQGFKQGLASPGKHERKRQQQQTRFTLYSTKTYIERLGGPSGCGQALMTLFVGGDSCVRKNEEHLNRSRSPQEPLLPNELAKT